jgi:tRNA (cytidine/uridine-2'-O-)-methyltransferase
MPRVVLVHPEIPPNTGNVARTCAAASTPLPLVEPLGFEITDRQLRRAGLDYWPLVDVQRHGDLNAFESAALQQGGRRVALTARGGTCYSTFRFREDDWLLFGCESRGLPDALLSEADARLMIPMPGGQGKDTAGVRSLNLSVAVGIVLFEALRQLRTPAGQLI